MQGARALWKLIKLPGIRQSKRIEWDFSGQKAGSSIYYMIIYTGCLKKKNRCLICYTVKTGLAL